MTDLGFPPKPYTQNANECVYSILKGEPPAVVSRKMSLKEVAQEIRAMKVAQERQVELSLIGRGEWKLLSSNKNLLSEEISNHSLILPKRPSSFSEKFNLMQVNGHSANALSK